MAKQTIVIVDDDEDLLRLLVSIFQSQGYGVEDFKTGTDAMKYLLDEKNLEKMSLIILDRVLPDMDGMEILTKFVQKFDAKVPILILSMLSAEKDMLEGLKKGAIDYLGKPFSIPVLMQKVQKLILNE